MSHTALFVFLFTILLSLPIFADDQPQPSEPQKIVSFLNQTIVWYRQQNELKQLENDPSDVLFLNDNEQVADDVVRQSFDFARNRAQVLNASSAPSPDPQNPTASRYQNLSTAVAKAEARLKEAQANIEAIRRKLETASGKARTQLQAALAEAQSEVELIQTRRDALKNMTQFLSGTSGLGAGSLQSQIDELARTVPISAVNDDKTAGPAKSQTTKASFQLNASNEKKNEPSGILALITDLLALRRKMETLDQA